MLRRLPISAVQCRFISTKPRSPKNTRKNNEPQPKQPQPQTRSPNKLQTGKNSPAPQHRPKGFQFNEKQLLPPFQQDTIPTTPVEKFEDFIQKEVHNGRLQSLALQAGLSPEELPKVANEFRDAVLQGKIPSIDLNVIERFTYHNNSDNALFTLITPYWVDYVHPRLDERSRIRFDRLRRLADMSNIPESYTMARKLDRKIFLHVGPTNSGKTYNAMQRMYKAESGVFCGPLRLLAREIYEKCNNLGVPCRLVTGEAIQEVDNARHVSSTVEMAPLGQMVDVAVIDEIQLIGDAQRGWAWTAAVLGMRARELHLCGEPSAVPLIQKICDQLSEKLEVVTYERLTPLVVSKDSLQGDLKMVEKGDCVVAFSKRHIFQLRKQIEMMSGLKCAVAYGDLPAESRAEQARFFNDPENEHAVLVASDAIGMGLNLNIRRVVFHKLEKWHGTRDGPVSVSQVKQIAGRAGRFATGWEGGCAMTLHSADVPLLEKAMSTDILHIDRAIVMPLVQHLEIFSSHFPHSPFSELLSLFHAWSSSNSNTFVVSDMSFFIDIARVFDDIQGLSLRERYLFACAPVAVRNESVAKVFRSFVLKYSRKKTVSIYELVQDQLQPAANYDALENLQYLHKAIMLYTWLSIRIPLTFCSPAEEVDVCKVKCEELIGKFLKEKRTLGAGSKNSGDQQRGSSNKSGDQQQNQKKKVATPMRLNKGKSVKK